MLAQTQSDLSAAVIATDTWSSSGSYRGMSLLTCMHAVEVVYGNSLRLIGSNDTDVQSQARTQLHKAAYICVEEIVG